VLIALASARPKTSVDSQGAGPGAPGFVVLATRHAGFGNSTGLIGLNSPDYEIADGRQLVRLLAARPEVTRRPERPRVGVTGGSTAARCP